MLKNMEQRWAATVRAASGLTRRRRSANFPCRLTSNLSPAMIELTPYTEITYKSNACVTCASNEYDNIVMRWADGASYADVINEYGAVGRVSLIEVLHVFQKSAESLRKLREEKVARKKDDMILGIDNP